MGGPTGEAYVSTLNATGLSREETLARESIQNSTDAIAPDAQKVTVRFRRKVLRGAEKRRILDAIKLQMISERREHLELAQGSILDAGEKEELALLYVEDFGTVGLTGGPHDPGSNFYRLLLSLGDSAKSRGDEGTGGSYGFGKAAYFLNSRIRTIFAYSAFLDPDTKAFESRIFGCGFFNRHTWENKSYTGRAWFGLYDKPTDAYPIVDPVTGGAVGDYAVHLGFTPRLSEETQGTSILILDTDLAIQNLLESIETWWWPKLIEHQIDILILDEETGEEIHPRPRSSRRADLKPFIDSYQVAVGSVSPIKPHQTLEEFNRIEGLEGGSLGLVMLTPEQDSATDENLKNCIALIRQPRMVIQYLQVSSVTPTIAGSFIGAQDIERYLKLSEPPAHNLWDPNAERLDVDQRIGARLVKSALDRIKRKAREFQNSATPPTPPKQNRLQRLERALGKYFMTKGRTQEKPETGQAPIHLAYNTEPSARPTPDGKLEMYCRFEVRLKEDAPEALRLRVKMNCTIMEDETHKGDDLEFQATADGVDIVSDPQDPRVLDFEIDKTQKARFAVVSAAYDPELTVSFSQEVVQL
jgi:hypothetical protein